jgi:hypothetical protein
MLSVGVGREDRYKLIAIYIGVKTERNFAESSEEG